MYSSNISPVTNPSDTFMGSPALVAEAPVDVVADGHLVVLGDAEQHADGAHGHLGAEVGDEVESAGPDERVEAVGAELPDLRLEGGHPLRA